MAYKRIYKYCLVMFIILLPSIGIKAAETQFPPIQALSYFPYSDNAILNKGVFSIGVDFHYSNTFMFNHERTIINDYESLDTTMGFRYGLFNRATVELFLRHTSLYGGFLDKAIEGFHSTFNLPDNARPEFPRNAVSYRYKDYFDYESNQSAFSAPIISLLADIYQNSQITVKGRLAWGLPLFNKTGFSSGKPFLSTGLILGFKRKSFSLEFSNYVSFFSTPNWLKGEQLNKKLYFSRLELEFQRFIGGLIFRSTPYREDDIAHRGYQMFIGYRFSRHFDFIILEDFNPFDTTPDISFNIRIRLFNSATGFE